MSQTATHRVANVIAHVPVRQWVLSLPIALRLLLAAQPELVTPVLQVVPRVITRQLRDGFGLKAVEEQATDAAAAAECEIETAQVRSGRISRARRLERVIDIDKQRCPNCGGGEFKIIAVIMERPVTRRPRLTWGWIPIRRLGRRRESSPAGGAGPVESARRGHRGAKSKHFGPTRAQREPVAGAILGLAEGV